MTNPKYTYLDKLSRYWQYMSCQQSKEQVSLLFDKLLHDSPIEEFNEFDR